MCQNGPQGALGDVSSCLETKFEKKMSMGSVPNCRKEIANRYGIRWFKCKLKPPKNRGRGYDKQSQYSGRYSSPQQGQYQYMPPPPTPPQSLLPTPPPYDPNWQLRQTQFYNSPAVAGYAPQGQYPQYPAPLQNTGDRQNSRPS